jgi:hypothetical protein
MPFVAQVTIPEGEYPFPIVTMQVVAVPTMIDEGTQFTWVTVASWTTVKVVEPLEDEYTASPG